MITLLLIAFNGVVSFIAFSAFRRRDRPERFLFVPAQVAAGGNYGGALLSNFAHADPAHLLFNMVTLFYFGPPVEGILGGASLLLMYIAAGVSAQALVYLMHRADPVYRSLGASGSIAGVLFAAIVLYPRMNIFMLFLPVPIPGPLFALGYLALSALLARRQRGTISHEAHIGGAVAGLALAGLLSPEGYGPLVLTLKALFSPH